MILPALHETVSSSNPVPSIGAGAGAGAGAAAAAWLWIFLLFLSKAKVWLSKMCLWLIGVINMLAVIHSYT